jgi:hypothetical protein
MALSIPIISTFDGAGVSKAIKEFQQLETTGQKAQFAIKKAALPAAAALAGIGAALAVATKGAMEDAAAQEELARQLKVTTGANDSQIESVEDWISAQGKLLGVTDDELRPALAGLVRATSSVSEAQKLASAAMDLAAQKGLPLSQVTKVLEKAYGGNLTALAKLAPEYRQMIKDGASFEDVMYAIGQATGGAATTAANTAAGKFARLKVQFDETKESVGALVLPIVEKMLPALQAVGNWAEKNTTAFVVVAGAIGGIAAAVVVVNAAMTAWKATTAAFTVIQTAFNAVMAMNPIGLVIIGIVALTAALAVAYTKFEGFRNIVDSVFGFIKTAVTGSIGFIKSYFETLLGFYKGIFNGIATLWNNTIGKLSFKIPSWVPGLGGKGFDVPNIPMLADGGIVTSPTLAMIGERGPEAVIPLTGRNAGAGMGDTNVTIQVNGGDPQSVVNALRTYMRQNGSVPIRVSNIF